jgi:hypothetical protein
MLLKKSKEDGKSTMKYKNQGFRRKSRNKTQSGHKITSGFLEKWIQNSKLLNNN